MFKFDFLLQKYRIAKYMPDSAEGKSLQHDVLKSFLNKSLINCLTTHENWDYRWAV